ncbi:TIGR02147 family protein [uncultured Fibrobacter sp.]|uniref:TIGR02147 family protein n=1 Tax=uncultured Fibrobacter sp. TaxID=261512 RepID=UPI0025F5EBD3|nr:TIGR02147 family protein [uncultured Fibrobacter sp.]
MKPIVEYQDYHAFLSDYYEERKRTSAFSWREFAKIAGFISPSYLKMVCEGKTNLSKVTMGRVAQAIGLVGYEVEYFETMVQFGNAKTDEAKKKFLEQMHSIALDHKVRIIDKDAFEYYDTWKNPVVRELAPLMPGAMPGDIAKACAQDVSALDVRKSLSFLERAGFLKQVRENVYEQTEKSVEGSKEGLPLAIRSMHRAMGNLAVDSLNRFTPDVRNVTGVTMGVNREAYEKIVAVLDECRKKITEIANECSDITQVYRLNLQLFPLSKEIVKKEEA